MTYVACYPQECDCCLADFDFDSAITLTLNVRAAEYELHACSPACAAGLATHIPADVTERIRFAERIVRSYVQRHDILGLIIEHVEKELAKERTLASAQSCQMRL